VLIEIAPPPDAMPAATQKLLEKQDTDERRLTNGSSSVVQFTPLLVPTIDGLPLMSPTAMHVRGVGQDTLAKESVPVGGVCWVQVAPSLVFTIFEPSTAVHSIVVTQEIDCGGKDESEIVQVDPPSVDFMIPAPPPA
jgi:hypothetical protein